MITVEKIKELKEIIRTAKQSGKKVGFVPTMGYFHEGHLSLMRRAKQDNDLVVVSLFVNPIQFGPHEDYQHYPRDLARDREMAEGTGADILFVPETSEIYGPNFQTFVEVTGVSQGLCGSSRPGHFRGVATVVMKLFNVVEPDRAYFGEKDAQQLRVIKQMVRDLNMNLQIIGCPIVREVDGLAMSSRNIYLNPAERQAALVLYQSLCLARMLAKQNIRETERIHDEMLRLIGGEPLAALDYLEIVDNETLEPVTIIQGEVLIALAVKIGKTRLIDNITIEV